MTLSEINIEPYDTLILDRDGTINVHLIGDYVKCWKEFEFIPGVLDAMPRLAKHFKHIFIVTNQRGIGKGKFTENDLADIHYHMIKEIENAGGRIDGIYYSTALTDLDTRRKPGRGMFDEIVQDYSDVVAEKTLMVGDGDVDEAFARNCIIAFCRVDSLKKENGEYKWVKV
jgi:D-glycero-D-manno-heptose 1,7-bisphosphate phosphatase